MMADGVFVIDGATLQGDRLHHDRHGHARPLPEPRRQEALRRQPRLEQDPRRRRTGTGSVSVIDFATRKVDANWPIPGGGSPDMGNVSADGKQLWLSGRYDNVVYVVRHDDRRGDEHPGRQGAARPHGLAAARPLLARPHRQHALRRQARRRSLEVGRGAPKAQRVASTSAATAASTPVAAAGDALHVQRRLDAGEAAEHHRLVHVAEVADAKDAAVRAARGRRRSRPGSARARPPRSASGSMPGPTSIAVTDTERASGTRVKRRSAPPSPQRSTAACTARASRAWRACTFGQAFGVDQAERRLEPGEVGERRRAAELAVREVALPALPSPSRSAAPGCARAAPSARSSAATKASPGWHHQALLRRADRDVGAERVHRERRRRERGDDVDDEQRRMAGGVDRARGSPRGRRSFRSRCRCGRRRRRRSRCARSSRSAASTAAGSIGQPFAYGVRSATPPNASTCSAQPSEKWPVPGHQHRGARRDQVGDHRLPAAVAVGGVEEDLGALGLQQRLHARLAGGDEAARRGSARSVGWRAIACDDLVGNARRAGRMEQANAGDAGCRHGAGW